MRVFVYIIFVRILFDDTEKALLVSKNVDVFERSFSFKNFTLSAVAFKMMYLIIKIFNKNSIVFQFD